MLRAQAPEPDIWLCFAPLKRDTTDLVVQKATELGASVLWPVFTERTNAARINADRLRADRHRGGGTERAADGAAVRQPATLRRMLENWPAGRRLLVALERADAAGHAARVRSVPPCWSDPRAASARQSLT